MISYFFQILAPSYELTIVGLCFLGIGTAALLVASFSGAQKAALQSLNVAPDDIYALISGIWTSSFALGNFIGPTLGGLLVDSVGFRSTTTVFQVGCAILLCVDLINLFCFSSKRASYSRISSKDQPKIVVTTVNVKSDLYEKLS